MSELESARTVVAKIGSSSITSAAGGVDPASVERLCAQVVELRALGHSVVLVSSGAIAAGWFAMGGGPRPTDPATLQAVSAVGQSKLMRVYDEAFAARGLAAGQVLLAPLDFIHRQQYLHARQTLSRLLELGVVPVVNENDATSDDEIRFGDNDRLAALVAHLVAADLLVLLTDTAGLLTADPRTTAEASLIEEVVEVDHELEVLAGGAGSAVGSGGMASKLAAAKIAAWSGVETVIADAGRDGVLRGAVEGAPGVGTVFRPRARRLPARKLWIAFAVAAAGTLVVDEGARPGADGTRGLAAPRGRGVGVGPLRRRGRRGDRRARRCGLRQGAGPSSFGAGDVVGGTSDKRIARWRRPRDRPPRRSRGAELKAPLAMPGPDPGPER